MAVRLPGRHVRAVQVDLPRMERGSRGWIKPLVFGARSMPRASAMETACRSVQEAHSNDRPSVMAGLSSPPPPPPDLEAGRDHDVRQEHMLGRASSSTLPPAIGASGRFHLPLA